MSLLLLFNQPPYHVVLLDTARRLAGTGDHEISVVTAQMACEIFTERAFVSIYQKRGLTYLEDPLDAFIPSYNLRNEKVRALYTALTGDDIGFASFWQSFMDLGKVRNAAVHSGARVQRAEADAGCAAAQQLIEHLERVVQSL